MAKKKAARAAGRKAARKGKTAKGMAGKKTAKKATKKAPAKKNPKKAAAKTAPRAKAVKRAAPRKAPPARRPAPARRARPMTPPPTAPLEAEPMPMPMPEEPESTTETEPGGYGDFDAREEVMHDDDEGGHEEDDEGESAADEEGGDEEPEDSGPTELRVGGLAPDFELPDERGELHRLRNYRGQQVVLYFYPRDDTPGCTVEACGFRDHLDQFTDRNAVVFGISPDTVDSHRFFVQKFNLTFPLLADADHRVAEQYGVWVEKQSFGQTKMGIARTTFVIDEDGRIARIFRNVKPDGHEREVLAVLNE